MRHLSPITSQTPAVLCLLRHQLPRSDPLGKLLQPSLIPSTRRPWISQVITPNYGVCWRWFWGGRSHSWDIPFQLKPHGLGSTARGGGKSSHFFKSLARQTQGDNCVPGGKKKTKKSLWFSLLFSIFFYFLPHHNRRSKWTWTPFRWMSCAAQRGMRRRRQMLLWWRSPRCLLTASIIQTHNMCSLACLWNLLSCSRPTIPTAFPSPTLFPRTLMSIWIDGSVSRRSHHMRARLVQWASRS